MRRRAEARGLADRLVLTGQIGDEALRVLYQRCAVFAFPSRYEGFGLPILEAMHCGAPVVAGDNSSQVEVAGDAGVLANADDPSDIAAGLRSILADPDHARTLAARGLARSRQFRWDDVARRSLDTLDPARARPASHRSADGELIALVLPSFRPGPPSKRGSPITRSGSSAPCDRIITSTCTTTPDTSPTSARRPRCRLARPSRSCRRHAGTVGYRGILYQMGNSYYHDFVYELIQDDIRGSSRSTTTASPASSKARRSFRRRDGPDTFLAN